MIKKYSFLIFVIVLAVVLFVAAYCFDSDDEKHVYAPQINLAKPMPSVSQEPDIITIHPTKLVYFYNDGDVFHIDPACSGMGTVEGRPCGPALDMGLRPCSICMKNYVIQ